ncbi:MAG TPA: hypothetical protein VEK79_02035 [Thermoanaerobaculia bacterium]|nr:hypothetical protein [Thermoanaerobaculia bacterium]
MLLACAMPLFAQSDETNGIDIDPTITQQEFEEFTRLAAQSIYATPVEPAKARGLLGFDIGIATTAVPVDPSSEYWQHATNDDFTYNDYLAVPRITASKGLSFGTISAMYSKVPDTDIQVWGASYDMPLSSGGIATPAVALRGAYSQLRGVEELDLSTYGVELFVSKGFGPITPYAAIGYARHKATGHVLSLPDGPTRTLEAEGNMNRYTFGLRVSMFIPKLVVETTQGEERSYAAKISVGF